MNQSAHRQTEKTNIANKYSTNTPTEIFSTTTTNSTLCLLQSRKFQHNNDHKTHHQTLNKRNKKETWNMNQSAHRQTEKNQYSKQIFN